LLPTSPARSEPGTTSPRRALSVREGRMPLSPDNPPGRSSRTSGNKKSSPRSAAPRAGGRAPAPPSAEQACSRDDDPDDERGQAGQQQDFMEDSAHLQPPGLED